MDDDLDIPQYDGNVSIESLYSSYNSENELNCSLIQNYWLTPQPIPVIITHRLTSIKPCQADRVSANIIIKHSNKKVLIATQLPLVVNLNPRSVYNKKEEFKTMMDQLDVDVCCMSESWDRQNMGLEDVIQMDGYQIVKNVLQRSGKGGKPALIIKNEKLGYPELCHNQLDCFCFALN